MVVFETIYYFKNIIKNMKIRIIVTYFGFGIGNMKIYFAFL